MKKILGILFLTNSLLLNATTYYIDPEGNDTKGNGTISFPWKSLHRACEVARFLGDIIHVNTGTYNESSQSSLAKGVSIEGAGNSSVITSTTLTSEWTPIIELNSTSMTNGNQSISYLKFDGNNLTAAQAIWIEKRNNIKIHHCTFTNFHWMAVYWVGNGGNETTPPTEYATGSQFYNNTVTNCAGYGDGWFRGALYIGGQEGMLIFDNTIIQTGRTEGTNGWPIKIWANGGWVKGLKIYNNLLFKDDVSKWDFAIEGLWTEGTEIYENIVIGSIDLNHISKGRFDYGLYVHNNTIGPLSIQKDVYHAIILESNIENVIIKYNRISNCAIGIYHTPRAGNHIQDYEISYNIFENCGRDLDDHYYSAIRFGEQEDNWTIKNFDIFNNVFYANETQNPWYGVAFNGFESALNINIINNIFMNFESSYFVSNRASKINILNIKNNILYNNGNSNNISLTGTPKQYTYSANIIDDPDFNLFNNYHILESSPAFSAGLPIKGTTIDFDGNPIGDPPNIGCFETIAELANPVIINAVVGQDFPTILEMTFDIILDNVIPDTSAFNVRINFEDRFVNSVIIDKNIVYLKLQSAVDKDDLIIISYSKPSINPLQSKVGKEVASINYSLVTRKVDSTHIIQAK
jgi:hypothetical protein